MTLGNMRALGVQRLIAFCHNHACRHSALLDVSSYPAETEVPYFRSLTLKFPHHAAIVEAAEPMLRGRKTAWVWPHMRINEHELDPTKIVPTYLKPEDFAEGELSTFCIAHAPVTHYFVGIVRPILLLPDCAPVNFGPHCAQRAQAHRSRSFLDHRKSAVAIY